MGSATKFIDFFVHDILDYTLLNKDSKNFTKNFTIFNIKMAISEISETLEDKVKLKDISVQTLFEGFDKVNNHKNRFLVFTDQKRLQ